MNFYQKYVKLCTSIQKSPSVVALENGISKSTVTAWKNKGCQPKLDTKIKIADYFGVDVSYFEDGFEQMDAKKESTPETGNGLDISKVFAKQLIDEFSAEDMPGVIADLLSRRDASNRKK